MDTSTLRMLPQVIDGADPGFLDPAQPGRLLSHPASKLLFAVYNQLAATGLKLAETADDCSAEQGRIVIEAPPGDESVRYWRFVPAARLGKGVLDEGHWPRLVVMCGYVHSVTLTFVPNFVSIVVRV